MANKKKKPTGQRPHYKKGQPPKKPTPASPVTKPVSSSGEGDGQPAPQAHAPQGTAPRSASAPAGQAAPAATGPSNKSGPSEKPAGGGKGKRANKTTQQARIEAARVARQRRSRTTRFAVVGVIVLVVALVGGFMLNNRRSAANTIKKLESTGCNFDTKADTIHAPPRNHVAPGRYEINPPAGGDHDPSPAGPGISDPKEGVPADGRIVHAMEHGYIVFWYTNGAPTADVEKLISLARDYPRDVLVVPRQQMDTFFAATAWERRLLCEKFDAETFELFLKSYVNDGPEKVKH